MQCASCQRSSQIMQGYNGLLNCSLLQTARGGVVVAGDFTRSVIMVMPEFGCIHHLPRTADAVDEKFNSNQQIPCNKRVMPRCPECDSNTQVHRVGYQCYKCEIEFEATRT